MRHFLIAWAFAAVPLFGTTALAEAPAPPDAGQDIVVRGDRLDNRRIDQFVEGVTRAPLQDQIPQFHVGVCPGSLGLTVAQNEAVVQRMRRVAAAAAIPLADPGCGTNVLVIVADDKRETIAALRERDPSMFSTMSAPQLKRLIASPEPVVAWQIEEIVGADNMPLNGMAVVPGSKDAHPLLRTITPPSRVSPAVRPVFVGTVVVIERHAVAGLSTTQLADYAALRTFARTDPKRIVGTGAPTILSIIEDGAAGRASPLSLTQWDLSFLRALYAETNVQFASGQRERIKQLMARDIEQAQQAE